MAAGQATTKSSTIVPILHLVFTIVSIVVLSYKVYHVESELSFIRNAYTHDKNNGLAKTLTHSTAAAISEHSRDKRSDRNRRLNQRTPETTSTKQNINADCIQKLLTDFQVCHYKSFSAVHGAKLKRIFSDVKIWHLFICQFSVIKIFSGDSRSFFVAEG